MNALAYGVSNSRDALQAGRISDEILTKWRKRRNGKWIPEDRMRTTALGLIFIPLSIFFSDLVTEIMTGAVTGLVVNVTCLFANDIGASILNFYFSCLP